MECDIFLIYLYNIIQCDVTVVTWHFYIICKIFNDIKAIIVYELVLA